LKKETHIVEINEFAFFSKMNYIIDMKDLGKTIDRLLKVDPALEEKLLPIKNKWKKYPGRSMNYWKELITFLNTDPSMLKHPKRPEISSIFAVKKRPVRQQLNSFEMVIPNDRIIGVIPENLSDEIKRHDREYIDVAKLQVEAVLTKSDALKAEVHRRGSILEIHNKKIWVKLKDHFRMWDQTVNVSIKKQENGLLAMVETPLPHQGFGGPGPQLPGPTGGLPNVFRIDPNTFRQFLQSLGLEPPEE
jgi:hypothetical protein